jgi:hypothetical protein
MNGNFGQPAEGECYNCWYGKLRRKYDQCHKCSLEVKPQTEFEELRALAIDTDQEKKTALRMKMGELAKEMAENGLNPRVIYGKGDVKAQRERYKKRVIEEKRFQCPTCQKVFTNNSGLKHHIANKICEKNKKENVNRDEKHNCECGGKFTTRHKASHFKTKKHLLYVIKKNENKNQ